MFNPFYFWYDSDLLLLSFWVLSAFFYAISFAPRFFLDESRAVLEMRRALGEEVVSQETNMLKRELTAYRASAGLWLAGFSCHLLFVTRSFALGASVNSMPEFEISTFLAEVINSSLGIFLLVVTIFSFVTICFLVIILAGKVFNN